MVLRVLLQIMAPQHSPTAHTSNEAPMEQPGSSNWLYVFQLPPGREALAAMRNSGILLDSLLSRRPCSHEGVRPEVVYAGVVGERNLKQAKLPEPDMAQDWDVAVIVRFPPGARASPNDVGAGVARAVYRFQVAPLPLPSQAQADEVADTPELRAVLGAKRPAQDAMIQTYHNWHAMMLESDGTQRLPIMRYPPVSGLNLLKYNAGEYGAPCYHRYLRGMYQIIHKNGGGLAYYGKVVKDAAAPEETQWDEIVIPMYPSGEAFFGVVFDPDYPELLALREASLLDSGNIEVQALEGSLFALP
ncbi:hypothetical protein WJX81_002264 [Elliptochloris bilobata]|uniref:Uncharacterized protein n=1 Tax=Elliptochloris bilobata TaxID=381761 RepID=A0AAW1RGH8_9CHLO